MGLAESFLKRALKKESEAEEHLKHLNYPESVSSSQECIKLSIQAMFLLLRPEYPKRHTFKDEEFEALFKKIPDKLRHLDFPRLFLYSKFWGSFYEMAKYGDERLGVGPEKLFRKEEAQLALIHARESRHAAHTLLTHLRHGSS
jgi:HEPN domain-containing protein